MRQIDIVKLYSQKRCLIIDDMPDIRVALTGMLRVFGVQEVDTAPNGEQAMEICRTTHYDMVLCDYNLGPGMDGQQVLEELRYRNRLNNTSIFVMVTAESSREMVLGALEYQPDDYVTKPITTSLLRTRLDRVVLRNRELYAIKQALDDKDYHRAIAACDERLNANTSYRSSCLQIQAEMNLRVFNFKRAEEIYQGVLKERPVVWAKLGLGKAQLAQKAYPQSICCFNDVIETDRRYVEAHDLLAEAYSAMGDSKKAQAAIQDAAEVSPKSVFRQRRLAMVAKLNEDAAALLGASRQAVRVGKNSCYESSDDYLNLARELTDLARDSQPEVANRYIKESFEVMGRLERRPQFDASASLQSHALKARGYAIQNKPEEVNKQLQQARSLLQQQRDVIAPEAQLEFARGLASTGNKQEAEQLLAQLAERNADNAELIARLDAASESPVSQAGRSRAAEMTRSGISCYEQKDYGKAIDIFKNAVSVFPGHLGLNLNLVQAIVANARAGQSDTQYERLCRNALNRVSEIDKADAQYARYQYLREQVNQLFPPVDEDFSIDF